MTHPAFGYTSFGWLGLLLGASLCFEQPANADGLVGARRTSAPANMSFESRFWNYLIANNYKNWAPATGQDGDFFHGQQAHGSRLKLYLNRVAISDAESLADESVIVLESYGSDKSLESISVMLKSAGTSPASGDWCWIVYRPDGSVVESSLDASADAQKIVARKPAYAEALASRKVVVTQSCAQCHRTAAGTDFVFFNDKK